ncbi:hypothetical protein MJG53_012621 [Ovis ammon polii x Ovis aries]|uniref:Uncharacterized protein n=1 Tax=Ovis ammon polii x Ovis aries TaxID=2918886 RepID=A0ACB9ULD5_9CETA|nr:hypothetical protein MJG53_012621 [Ovis ammon polii x Ovis aries]
MDTDRVRLCFYRLLQLFSTCAAFSLVASLGTGMGAVSHWSMFIWCFCFVITLITFIVQLGEYQPSLPFSGKSFLFTYACLATAFCLSASIMYAITYIQFLPHGPFRDQAAAAAAFSCIACVLYALEGAFLWLLFPETTFYFATIHGLFKLLETSVACIIFAFISNTSLHQHQPALVWCVAVYSICFTLGAVAMLLKLVKFESRLHTFFPHFLLGQTMLSVLLYASALVLWPLYQFNEEFGGQPQRSGDVSCSDELPSTLCIWDQKLTVAILTAINLLIHVADMAYWIHFIFIREDNCRVGDCDLLDCHNTMFFTVTSRDKYYELSEIPCYVHTIPGLLKVLQTFVACLIFTFLSHTSLYLHQPALEWCVAVHSICFFPAALTILGNLIGWEYRLPVTFPIFRFPLTLLSVLLYVSALVLWLLYQFNEKFGGQPQRSNYMDCIDGLTYYICTWDEELAVAILTALNPLIYVAGLVYWARQVSVGIED